MTKKTPQQRKEAHRIYEQRRASQFTNSSLNPVSGQMPQSYLVPGKSISLEAFGNVVYAGTLRGKEVFLTGYNEDRKTVQEIAVREGGIALISGMNYQIVGDSIKREVGLSIHRHGQEAVNYFANGGRV